MASVFTDRPPKQAALLAEFRKSDKLGSLEFPTDGRLVVSARSVEATLKDEDRAAVRRESTELLVRAADFYRVSQPSVRVLAARPLRVREGGWGTELFGDYDPATKLIRVWMRTAIFKNVTSFGTFLSTLCHEFCHHLDYQRLGFQDSWHTRGFYERTAALYHHARQTPPKRLFWAPVGRDRWRIDWPRTNRGE
jgi:hypothetical protein